MAPSNNRAHVMSMAEIAELARVQRPVVSNWRRRHDTFPQPSAGDQSHPLFDAHEVADWLVETGRAERFQVEGDLRLYTLARLGSELPPRRLIASLTALICLRHLTDEPLDDGKSGLLARLHARAAEVNPADDLLLSEVEAVRESWLPRVVDELVEAAWGTRDAFERVMEVLDRLGAAELSADRPHPALRRLVATLADAAHRADLMGAARIVAPYAGVGDLALAITSTLRDDQLIHLTVHASDANTARLLRRRLTVQDLHDGTIEVVTDVIGRLDDADIIVAQLPYLPAEERTVGEALDFINETSLQLARGATAVIVAPADTIAGLDPASGPGQLRAQLIKSGAVHAIIRMPGGLLPYRPGYEAALWVLHADYESPLRGRVLLADVSDREPSTTLIEMLATDVLTWRREGFDPGVHSRTLAVPVAVSALVGSTEPWTPRYLPGRWELSTFVPERVARALDLELVLRDARPEQPMLHANLATRAEPVPPPTVSIAELIRGGRQQTNRLSIRKGVRIDAALVLNHAGAQASYLVIGSTEVLGRSAPAGRRVDRLAFEAAHPHAQRSEPGDVIITASPEPAAIVDHDGYAVVEFPARILRITRRGTAHFTPRVLAALLNRPGRVPGTIRSVQRLEDVRLPLLAPEDLAHLDRLLAELDVRRRVAKEELDALDELRSIAASGLTDGTLTLTNYVQQ